jgi:hypothetical protein
MTTDNFCFYLKNRLIRANQTGGQQYSDTSRDVFWEQKCLPTPLWIWAKNNQNSQHMEIELSEKYATLETAVHVINTQGGLKTLLRTSSIE